MYKNNYTKNEILRLVSEEDVKFIRLQFLDVLGTLKNVAITNDQLSRAIDEGIVFDGSSIEGFIRKEEFDMYLKPDLSTFQIFPWRPSQGKVARMVCDIYTSDGKPFEGDPRGALKNVISEAKDMGYELDLSPELEFFLFHTDENGHPTTETHDQAGYFDLGPIDLGENVRRDIVLNLEEMGFDIKASHHENAPGQHEIDFNTSHTLGTADSIATFKLVVKVIAQRHGLHATFMPKPISGVSGSGMHLNMALYNLDGKNVFYDGEDENQLSKTAYYFIGGLLAHAKAVTAITNPTVNSYKRLTAGHEAPRYIGWSKSNTGPLVRIPSVKNKNSRIEFRSPDPSCNPYLSLAVVLKAGLDGIKNKITPPEQLDSNNLPDIDNIFDSEDLLPHNLSEALTELSRDTVIKEAIGDIHERFIKAKTIEWNEYLGSVSQWEINKYISKY